MPDDDIQSLQQCNAQNLLIIWDMNVNCFFGYTTSKNKITNFEQGMGYSGNAKLSVGFYAHSNYQYFTLFDNKVQAQQLLTTKKPTNGSVVRLSFHFKNDNLTAYHDDKKAGETSLNGNKSVIPGVSLCNKDDSIEIIKYELG